MNGNELIKNTLGGIVMGFSIGIGFILAQKLMSKKKAESVNDEPHSNFNSNNTPLNTTDKYISQIKEPNNWDEFKPDNKKSPFGNMDFTTGKSWQ
tara:strand:- start:3505 stop:3789 length:285 start_codon:yes stop_codon:yes gene_type:complete